MARYASGRKSKAISDISGFKVNYTSLKTTYDHLRVEPEEFDIKHPQLTPAKNIIDATALFQPRVDNDQEETVFVVGFNYDIFADKRNRPAVGIIAHSSIGQVNIEITITEVGVAATGAIGSELLELSINEIGVAGVGATGVESAAIAVTGIAGSGAIGTEGFESTITEAGVAGTGAIGTEVPTATITEAGLAGTGAVGAEAIKILGWGNEAWGTDTWGDG